MAQSKKKTIQKKNIKSAKVSAKKSVAKPAKKAPSKAVKSSKKTPSKVAKAAVKVTQKASKAKPQKKVTKSESKKTLNVASQSKTSSVSKTGNQTIKLLKALDLHPLGDRVLVVLDGSGERLTAGGLIIPDTATDTSGNRKGQVVAVGKGQTNKQGKVLPLDVSPGDRVLFSEYAGSKVQFANEQYVILRENEILGVVIDQ
ncbi:MAG TPA: co-chaperone GroES [Pseudobdellovibrionaceae bacterium]|nr:co-chaperone GroES [Pseudobdellovibrionaceae bacterium]